MTLACEQFTKQAGETKAIIVDCSGVLARAETINSISSITQTNDDDEATDVTISGEAVNAAEIHEPDKCCDKIEIGKGIEFFVAAGTADTLYTLAITYVTSSGQVLIATARLKVD